MNSKEMRAFLNGQLKNGKGLTWKEMASFIKYNCTNMCQNTIESTTKLILKTGIAKGVFKRSGQHYKMNGKKTWSLVLELRPCFVLHSDVAGPSTTRMLSARRNITSKLRAKVKKSMMCGCLTCSSKMRNNRTAPLSRKAKVKKLMCGCSTCSGKMRKNSSAPLSRNAKVKKYVSLKKAVCSRPTNRIRLSSCRPAPLRRSCNDHAHKQASRPMRPVRPELPRPKPKPKNRQSLIRPKKLYKPRNHDRPLKPAWSEYYLPPLHHISGQKFNQK